MRVLVTGGCGFIGSHTAVQLMAGGHDPVLFDNLSNSKPAVIDRLEVIAGRRPELAVGDVRDRSALDRVLATGVEAVIHFAGLKAVGESVAKPLEYYDNNVNGTLVLTAAMEAADVRSLVFSSSATVYGDPAPVPITEGFPTSQPTPMTAAS